MSEYEGMSVHDLIGEAMYIGAEHLMVMKDLIPAIESAIKAAVIREASIGEVFFTTDEHPVAIGAKELKVGGRVFDLILKEAPQG